MTLIKRLKAWPYSSTVIQVLLIIAFAIYLIGEFKGVIARTGDPKWSLIYAYANSALIIGSFLALSFSLIKSIPDRFYIFFIALFLVYVINAFFTYHAFEFIVQTPNPSEYIQLCFKRMKTDSPWKVLFRKDNFFFTMALSISYILKPLALKGAYDTFRYANRIFKLREQNLKLELDLLKLQLHPHFFLNTLNNIYSMVQVTNKDAAGYIMRLSEMMRYSLYESNSEKVSLRREIEFLESYLELERIRHTPSRVTIDFTTEEETGDWQIPPVVLVILVENAFKHGVNTTAGRAWVHIRLQIKGGRLLFSVRNSKPVRAEMKDQLAGGIGLGNLRKRLDLYYPNAHELILKKEPDCFEATLTIDL